jgi:hypothetical protein
METTTNIKTIEEIRKSAKAYLTKTSKHLLATADGYLYKIESFERDGKLYYATIFMGNGKVIINVSEAISDRQYSYVGNNALSILQQNIFPAYLKTVSLPYFKKMRAIIKDLMLEISTDNVKNKDLAEKFKTRLPELVKEEKA